MNVITAFKNTLELIKLRANPDGPDYQGDLVGDEEHPASVAHFEDMLKRMEYGMPADVQTGLLDPQSAQFKMHRWLGWLQGVATTSGLLTLSECKEINHKA